MPYIYKMSNAGGMSTLTRYTDMLAGNATFIDSSFESISTVTVGAGGAASVTFSSIPATYTHLQIRGIGKSTQTSYEFDGFNVLINSNTSTANYTHMLSGSGAAASSEAFSGTGSLYLNSLMPSNFINASIFGATIIDILNYASTVKNPVLRTFSGFDPNDTNNGRRIALSSSALFTTGAITSISLNPITGNFAQYSSFALYGIKG